VEASWDLFPEFRAVWLGVLANQAVYLLAVSEQKEKAHEIANLMRIMQLLVRHKVALESGALQALLDTLADKLAGKITTGLSIDANNLKEGHSTMTGP
jgi:hypothetical protein